MPRRNTFSELRSNPLRLVIFVIGVIVFLYGLTGISISAGLSPFSLVTLQTPVGTVATSDRQFGGGLIVAFLGIVMMFGSVIIR
ncbi:MAG: hypothetical protein ACLP5V_09940 [Candidatus Bathyarchaeia archaeon]